ncbi:MAG: hypothetical protein J5777_06850 [Clostridiales bacterium]|nr:hypothetical protein [Clostridiales bacterium]
MKYFGTYIPQEYLALKINYCRQKLESLPAVTMHEHNYRGSLQKRVVVGSHRYSLETPEGNKYYGVMLLRNDLEEKLQIYESIWKHNFIKPVPEYEVPKIARTLNTGYEKTFLNRDFFDSLKEDANKNYSKSKAYAFNGINYRSAAEREIAVFYTEAGIPFKYEPEVWFKGMSKPAYPDFVVLIPELDTCKFHEHCGLMNFNNYVREVTLKCGTYSGAGLMLDQDVYFTYSSDDVNFDIRYLAAKLNAVVYGTILNFNQ